MTEKEPVNAQISKIIWDKNVNLIERFIDKIHDRQGLDLTLSTDAILEQTHLLDLTCRMFLDSIDKMWDNTNNYDNLRNEKSEKESRKLVNAKYITEEIQTIKVSVPTKKATIYCTTCVFSCKTDCTKKNTIYDKGRYCKSCPKKCHTRNHKDHPYIIKEKNTIRDKIDCGMKAKFEQVQE